MFNYSEKSQKGVFFLFFEGFERPRIFRLATSRSTIFFDLVKPQMPPMIQKIWVSD